MFNPLQLLPNTPSPPYPPHSCSFSQKHKTEQNKEMIDKKWNTLCWPVTPGCGTCPRVWLMQAVSQQERKLISPL